MDINKLVEDSDPLIAAPELNEGPQGKVQSIFIMLAQSLYQRKTAGNRVKYRASFLADLLWSFMLENLHTTQSYITHSYK